MSTSYLGDAIDSLSTLGIVALSLLAGLLVICVLVGIFYAIYFLITLPLRRRERARFFLDLLAHGLNRGQSPQHTILTQAEGGDRELGGAFQILATRFRTGFTLSQALLSTPRLLPPQIRAMLEVGDEIGDVRKILPACRHLSSDGLSHTLSAFNYLIALLFVVTPVIPIVLIVL